MAELQPPGSGKHGDESELERRYFNALRRYVETQLELPLAEAWELARLLASEGKGLSALVDIHRAALQRLPHGPGVRQRAFEFLSEALGPFEMMLRGYREAAQTLRAQHDQLQAANQALQQSHAVISAQRDALIEAERRQHEISAFIVHDLKNPLAVVQVNLQYALSDPGAPDAPEALEDALESSQRLGGMVANLLDVYRGGEGRLVARKERLAASELLQLPVQRLARRARNHAQTVTAQTPAELVVHGDRELLQRVLENLTDNAAKHTPDRGQIRLSARPEGGGTLLEVCDSGPGIPPDQREAIFEKFVQLAPDGAPRASHGLGLVFCKLVAEAHGGRIWVETSPEGGCAFRLWLPDETEGTAVRR